MKAGFYQSAMARSRVLFGACGECPIIPGVHDSCGSRSRLEGGRPNVLSLRHPPCKGLAQSWRKDGRSWRLRNARAVFTWQLSHFSPLPLYSGGEGSGVRGGERPLQIMEFPRGTLHPLTPALSPFSTGGEGEFASCVKVANIKPLVGGERVHRNCGRGSHAYRSGAGDGVVRQVQGKRAVQDQDEVVAVDLELHVAAEGRNGGGAERCRNAVDPLVDRGLDLAAAELRHLGE